MSRVIVVTDSNSGITQSEAKELGVVVMPMPFYINGHDLAHKNLCFPPHKTMT